MDGKVEYIDKVSVAFLLVIHNNPELVNLFIQQLLRYDDSYVYIHVDAKSLDIIPCLELSERVIVVPKHFDVKWGDYTQIQVNNYLIQFASSIRHHDFYSLHSGADLMIRPVEEFVDYLKNTNCYGYYECIKLPSHWQFGGGLGRLALKWPKCFRKRLGRKSPMRYIRSIYGRLYGMGILHGKELPKEYSYYGGADWFTIRYDCAEELLYFSKQEKMFEKLFIDSLSGAEIYYVSIFQMTKKNRKVEDHNMLRYIDWKDRGQKLTVGSPNTCSMTFLKDIEMSGAFFARKFDMGYDKEIVEYFLKEIGYDGNIRS